MRLDRFAAHDTRLRARVHLRELKQSALDRGDVVVIRDAGYAKTARATKVQVLARGLQHGRVPMDRITCGESGMGFFYSSHASQRDCGVRSHRVPLPVRLATLEHLVGIAVVADGEQQECFVGLWIARSSSPTPSALPRARSASFRASRAMGMSALLNPLTFAAQQSR